MATATIDQGSTSYDGLIAGSAPTPIEKWGTLVSGQSVVRGQMLGIVTASGKYATYASNASNGTEVANAICAQTCDATSGDLPILIYQSGTFNEDRLTLSHSGDTITDAIREVLRKIGIYIRTAQDSVAN